MPLRYLLDTNVISDLVRNPQGSIAARITVAGEDAVCTSVVVAAELRYGAKKSASAELKRRVAALLSALTVVPLEEPIDEHYADIRHTLTRAGNLIGPNDLLIAAHARALGVVLVTANTAEFSRVPGLALDNWLTPA